MFAVAPDLCSRSLKSRRKQFATNMPSASCDYASSETPLRSNLGFGFDNHPASNKDSVQTLENSVSQSRMKLVQNFGHAEEPSGSSRKCSRMYPKQISDDSQHSTSAATRSGAEGHTDDMTPDEHLSSPEMPRRSPTEMPGPSAASPRSKFRVDPRADVAKLSKYIIEFSQASFYVNLQLFCSEKIPTMVVDTYEPSGTPPVSPESTRKFYNSDSHLLNSNQQSKAVQVGTQPDEADPDETQTQDTDSVQPKNSDSFHNSEC